MNKRLKKKLRKTLDSLAQPVYKRGRKPLPPRGRVFQNKKREQSRKQCRGKISDG